MLFKLVVKYLFTSFNLGLEIGVDILMWKNVHTLSKTKSVYHSTNLLIVIISFECFLKISPKKEIEESLNIF
jgi:hypothetical protein